MKTSCPIKAAKQLLGAVASLCALLNFTALGTPGILDTAVNPANNHVYYLLANSNWTDAQSAAVGIGGNLATVNDLAENNWVWNLWGTNRNLWIGLRDPVIGDGTGTAHAANFAWVSGDASAYRNWRAGEPNNSSTGEYDAYILGKGLSGGGQWNDGPDVAAIGGQFSQFGVVEVVPEPSSGLLLAGGMLAALGSRRLRSRK